MSSKGTVIAARTIKVKHRGNALGFWFFRQMLKFFGLRGAYFLLSGVAFHYLVFDADARRRTMAYVRRRFPNAGFWENVNAVYRIFVNQGQNLIDQHASLTKAVHFDLRMDNKDSIDKVRFAPEGFVLLTSHVGNWQIAMPALAHIDKKVYLVMRREDNRAVARYLGVDRENAQVRLISPEGDFGGAIEIVRALGEGAIVSMTGDRRYDFDGVKVPSFLGAPAFFPFGAFHIAAACKVPVAVFLSAKTGPLEYTVSISRLIYPVYEKGSPKKDQIARWVGEYTSVLEEFVQKYPYQCFIFNDVWKEQ